MNRETVTRILIEYNQESTLFGEFIKVVHGLLDNLLKRNQIRVHSIFDRLKDKQSLEKKLNRPKSTYEKLEDVTDICGIRIITFFNDEVDTIASLISKEFEIDRKNSVDKRMLVDPDRFGYRSLHYVVKLKRTRLRLPEYSGFSDCKIEIQIRSILQHTWAEIEHDLGYKSKISVPKEIQRRFFQLASLLELADDEFLRIRNFLSNYASSVKEKINKTPESLSIDQVSVSFYIESSSLVKEIERDISYDTKVTLTEDKDIADLIDRLNNSGLKTIDEIESNLKKYQKHVLYFAEKLMGSKESREGFYPSGISIFYLCYVLIASSLRIEDITEFLSHYLSQSKKLNKTFAVQLISWYKEASQST